MSRLSMIMALVNRSRQCNETPICTVDPDELLVGTFMWLKMTCPDLMGRGHWELICGNL